MLFDQPLDPEDQDRHQHRRQDREAYSLPHGPGRALFGPLAGDEAALSNGKPVVESLQAIELALDHFFCCAHNVHSVLQLSKAQSFSMVPRAAPSSAHELWRAWRQALAILLGGAVVYVLFDALLFRTGFYNRILDPHSSTGVL